MQIPLIASLLAICPLVPAQSNLDTTWSSNRIGVDGGNVYFDLEVATTITLDRLELNFDAPIGSAGSIEVYLGPETWLGHTHDPAEWALATSGSFATAGIDQPTACPLSTPLTLGPGNYGMAIRHLGAPARYTLGNGFNEEYSSAELTFRGGGATNAPFSGTPLAPRVLNGTFHYSLGGTPIRLATIESYGSGCYAVPGAFYEEFGPAQHFDLNNTTLRLLPNQDGGYDVVRTQGAIFIPPAAGVLPLGDDMLSVVHLPFLLPFPGGVTNSLRICSNGYVWLQPASAADYTPTVDELIAQPARLALAWMDFNPGALGSGTISYERDPADRFVTVTFDDVWQHGTVGTSLSTFQAVFYPSGEIEIRYGSVDHGTDPCIVGFTPGDENLGFTPAATDLSAISVMPTAFARPLTLTAGPRAAPSATVSFTTSNVPAQALLTLNLMSIQAIRPGIDLGSLGAPGCQHLVSSDTAEPLITSLVRTLGPLPTGSNFTGLPVFSQSACLVSGVNDLGLLTSNGIAIRLGDL